MEGVLSDLARCPKDFQEPSVQLDRIYGIDTFIATAAAADCQIHKPRISASANYSVNDAAISAGDLVADSGELDDKGKIINRI
jgi:hypothetical protein